MTRRRNSRPRLTHFDGHLGEDAAARLESIQGEHLDLDTIDLGGVTTVDGRGVEALVAYASRLAARGRSLTLLSIRPTVAAELRKFGLGDLLRVRRCKVA